MDVSENCHREKWLDSRGRIPALFPAKVGIFQDLDSRKVRQGSSCHAVLRLAAQRRNHDPWLQRAPPTCLPLKTRACCSRLLTSTESAFLFLKLARRAGKTEERRAKSTSRSFFVFRMTVSSEDCPEHRYLFHQFSTALHRIARSGNLPAFSPFTLTSI